MRYSALSVVGFIVFIAALFMGIFAYLLNWTSFWAELPAFEWTLGRLTIFRLELGADGGRIAHGWNGLWFVSIIGQLVMLSSLFLKPQQSVDPLR